ncbi:MAG: YggT family protein [Ruminococcaceae bacterium]|nr:YggT family protein [Oscillospiraceae bacterium]
MRIGIIFYLLSSVLYAFDLLLLVRAICSWVPSFRESIVYRIAYTVTEPILRPVRDLLYRIEWVRRCPLDLSFLVVVLLVNGLSNLLSYLAVLLG